MTRDGFRVDASQLERAGDALAAGADDVLGDVAHAAIPRMAERVHDSVRVAAAPHRRTGRLEQLVTLEEDGAGILTTATVRVAGRVAPIIVHGSRPHAIRPLGGRGALAFAGAPRGFASRVDHPGTRPDPFFARGVRAAEASIDTITDAAAGVAVARLAELAEG